MDNPYQSPSTAQISKDIFEVARRKLFIGSSCLAVAGLFCGAVTVFAGISWYGDRNDELQSALQPFMPIILAIHLFVGVAIVVSLYGLAKRRTWSISTSIICLAISGMSVLLPICGVGIWALMDHKIKHYFKKMKNVG